MILLHTSMALMDSDVSSTCFNCLETSTTSAMVRLLPSTARVALVGTEGSRHCERTKAVNEGIEGAMLIQNKAGSQKSKGKEGTMKVPLFYILFHLQMAIYNIYQRLRLLRSVIATCSDGKGMVYGMGFRKFSSYHPQRYGIFLIPLKGVACRTRQRRGPRRTGTPASARSRRNTMHRTVSAILSLL